jgi:membrane-associated phospholipid phosphatase
MSILGLAYGSTLWQPFVAIVVSANLRPRQRNAELLTTLSVAMLLTLVIFAFAPAIGPDKFEGSEPDWAPIIRALQASPSGQVFQYAGLISFPSFHTVMALLFAYTFRGIRLLFPAAIGLNALMVVSIPYSGDHYLVDLAAGALVAILAIAATKVLMRGTRPSSRSTPLPATRLAASGG